MQWSLILQFLMSQCCFINCQLYEYHYIRDEKTWTEAQQYCRDKHTDLATVTSMTDMKRLLNITAGKHRDAWIGLFSKPEFNRTWYWSLPGVEFNESETNWNPGEPSDKGIKGSENCVFLKQNAKWLDTMCRYERYFICYNETNRTHKYHFIKEQKTWQKAQSYCRENHIDLISGLKQLQDEELKKVMNFTGDELVYIGLFRDNWRWSDGSSFSFRHWHEGFNNEQADTDRCAMIGSEDDGRWKNEDCSVRKPFMCYDDKVILIKENKTWEEALYYCREHQHDLVTITNLDEQRWVQEKVKNASSNYVWMGLRYSCTMNVWFWVCKEMVSYKSRASDCDISGAIETAGEHRWFQKSASERFNLICFN